jgi:hypothetical protein
MGSVRVFLEPNRTEPKKLRTESNRTDSIFKSLRPDRIELKKFETEPNRTEPNKCKLIKTHGKLRFTRIDVLYEMIFSVRFILTNLHILFI